MTHVPHSAANAAAINWNSPDLPVNDARIGLLMRRAVLFTAVWTVPVIIGTAGHYFGIMVEGGGMPASHIFGHSFAMWYVWIPATPAILWAYRRLPFSARGWPRAALAHLGIIAAVFFAQSWLTLVVGHATGHVRAQTGFLDNVTALVVNLLLYDILIYAGIIAVAVGRHYQRRYRDRDLRASQLETQLERAHLEALQAQLQPHFLFNALNSIAMLVRRDRKQEALDTVIGFGELLRYVLDEAGTIDVPLGEEVRFVRRYLEIEQVRHQARLRVEFAIAVETERALVPNLLLQPLVENALKHGISRLPEGGVVRISAERRGGFLRIEVTNDGPALADHFSLDTTDGLGLRNLRERLTALIGGAAVFRLGPAAEGTGVCAVVELPYRDSGPVALERAG